MKTTLLAGLCALALVLSAGPAAALDTTLSTDKTDGTIILSKSRNFGPVRIISSTPLNDPDAAQQVAIYFGNRATLGWLNQLATGIANMGRKKSAACDNGSTAAQVDQLAATLALPPAADDLAGLKLSEKDREILEAWNFWAPERREQYLAYARGKKDGEPISPSDWRDKVHAGKQSAEVRSWDASKRLAWEEYKRVTPDNLRVDPKLWSAAYNSNYSTKNVQARGSLLKGTRDPKTGLYSCQGWNSQTCGEWQAFLHNRFKNGAALRRVQGQRDNSVGIFNSKNEPIRHMNGFLYAQQQPQLVELRRQFEMEKFNDRFLHGEGANPHLQAFKDYQRANGKLNPYEWFYFVRTPQAYATVNPTLFHETDAYHLNFFPPAR